jgi:hypothetical protein
LRRVYDLLDLFADNPFDEPARAGQEIFIREGCAGCHTPPLYTSNKITLARGFTLPSDVPKTLDVLPVSVGTDPSLALRTRKGTGYYKVPSLIPANDLITPRRLDVECQRLRIAANSSSLDRMASHGRCRPNRT